MSCKTFLAFTVLATMASMILSIPTNPVLQVLDRPPFRPAVQPVTLPAELSDETKEVIVEYVAEKMEEAYPNMLNEIQTRANLFNLSAYLNTNRPNTTALTFVPLITLLSGFFSGTG